MKTTYQQRLSDKLAECPGHVYSRAPVSPVDEGEIVVEPVCSKIALDFLKRRFRVEKQVGVESSGELKFIISPRNQTRVTRTGVRVRYQKPVQFLLAL